MRRNRRARPLTLVYDLTSLLNGAQPGLLIPVTASDIEHRKDHTAMRTIMHR